MTDLEYLESVRTPFGTGDGVTLSFGGNLWRTPVERGSVVVTVWPTDAISQLANTVDPRPLMRSRADSDTGAFGSNYVYGVVNYQLGHIQVNFQIAPPKGSVVRVEYEWRPPRLRYCKVQVDGPAGKEWVDIDELRDALNRG